MAFIISKSAGKVSRFSLLIESSERNLSCYFDIIKPRKCPGFAALSTQLDCEKCRFGRSLFARSKDS